MLVWIVYAYVVVTEAVLGLGFLLLLFGANPDASFVAWVYRSLERAMEPFRGMFTPIELGLSGNDEVGAVLDTSVLFAMLAYAVAAWLVSWLLDWITGFLARLDAADLRADRQAWREAQAANPATNPAAGPAPTYPTPPGASWPPVQ